MGSLLSFTKDYPFTGLLKVEYPICPPDIIGEIEAYDFEYFLFNSFYGEKIKKSLSLIIIGDLIKKAN